MSNDTRTIKFAGRQWIVKSGVERGPGPNCWSDSEQSVWVDENGWLHLRIREIQGVWHCAEVYTKEPSIYGLHRFYTIGWLDRLDPNVVFAPFLYKDDETEIDIEFTKWGQTDAQGKGQYVVQPYNHPDQDHLKSFDIALQQETSLHSLDWQTDKIQFKSMQGHDLTSSEAGRIIYEWTYNKADIPKSKDGLHVHINLWLFQGRPPTDGQGVEITVKKVLLPEP